MKDVVLNFMEVFMKMKTLYQRFGDLLFFKQ